MAIIGYVFLAVAVDVIELQSAGIVETADGTDTPKEINYYFSSPLPPLFNSLISFFAILVRHYILSLLYLAHLSMWIGAYAGR